MILSKLQRNVLIKSFWQSVYMYRKTNWLTQDGQQKSERLNKAIQLGGITYDLVMLEEDGRDKSCSERAARIWYAVRELVVEQPKF